MSFNPTHAVLGHLTSLQPSVPEPARPPILRCFPGGPFSPSFSLLARSVNFQILHASVMLTLRVESIQPGSTNLLATQSKHSRKSRLWLRHQCGPGTAQDSAKLRSSGICRERTWWPMAGHLCSNHLVMLDSALLFRQQNPSRQMT